MTPESVAPAPQLGLAFAAAPVAPSPAGVSPEAIAEVIEALRAIDADDLSPRAALDLVARLTKKLTPSS
jgi:hypothetical protein